VVPLLASTGSANGSCCRSLSLVLSLAEASSKGTWGGAAVGFDWLSQQRTQPTTAATHQTHPLHQGLKYLCIH